MGAFTQEEQEQSAAWAVGARRAQFGDLGDMRLHHRSIEAEIVDVEFMIEGCERYNMPVKPWRQWLADLKAELGRRGK